MRKRHLFRLGMGTLIGVSACVVFLFFARYGRTGTSDLISGWFWNAYKFSGSTNAIGLGWVSENCANDFNNDGRIEYECKPGANYGLTVDNGHIKGCAWSALYGWVCFNGGAGATYQCNSTQFPGCANLSAAGVATSSKSFSGGSFSYLSSPGYSGGTWGSPSNVQRAMILSLATPSPDKGYIGFPIDPDDAATASTTTGMLTGCTGCHKVCSNNKTITCTSEADCGGSACIDFCNACLNVSADAEDPITNSSPNILCWACGNAAGDCRVGVQGGSCIYNKDKNSCKPSSCSRCTNYTGVIVNEYPAGKYELCGWGYHAYDEGAVVKGLGWVPFGLRPDVGNIAYVDVGAGNILSGGNVYSPAGPPVGRYNAAYLIQASGDIINWFSQESYNYGLSSNLPKFPKETIGSSGSQTYGRYSNVLGTIDLAGLRTDARTGESANLTASDQRTKYKNKFGSPLFVPSTSSSYDDGIRSGYLADAIFDNINAFNPLDTAVIYYAPSVFGQRDIFVPAGQFTAGSSGKSGSGVIVIKSNTYITGDVTYENPASLTSLKQIPSVVWIIEGNLYIDPIVEKLAGTFLVFGDVYTGSSSNQLVVTGSMIARQFHFERKFNSGKCSAGSSNPGAACTMNSECTPGLCERAAERFIADGRLQANPPLGMTDFSKAAPRFSSSY